MRRKGRVICFLVYCGLKVIFSLNKSPSLQGEYNLSKLKKQYKDSIVALDTPNPSHKFSPSRSWTDPVAKAKDMSALVGKAMAT